MIFDFFSFEICEFSLFCYKRRHKPFAPDYKLRIVVTGNSWQIYLDDTLRHSTFPTPPTTSPTPAPTANPTPAPTNVQLMTIKDVNYVTPLDTICGVSIVQPQSKSQSKSKRKKRNKSNYKVVFTLFTESETERAFEAARMNDFKSELCSLIQLVETSYTLFRKTLNNKDFIFLMVGNHINDSIEEYRLVDILQSMIIDLCQSLQIKCVKTKYKSNNDEKSQQIKERKMSLTAMVEILEEVFGGSSDDTYPLNKTEFVTCMTVRLGMFNLNIQFPIKVDCT